MLIIKQTNTLDTNKQFNMKKIAFFFCSPRLLLLKRRPIKFDLLGNCGSKTIEKAAVSAGNYRRASLFPPLPSRRPLHWLVTTMLATKRR